MNLDAILFLLPWVATRLRLLAKEQHKGEGDSNPPAKAYQDELGQIVQSDSETLRQNPAKRFGSIGQAITSVWKPSSPHPVENSENQVLPSSQTPLVADGLSRLNPPYQFYPVPEGPLPSVNYDAEGKQGEYTITLKIPEGLFSNDDRTKLVEIMEELNHFSGIPIILVRWDIDNKAGRYFPPKINQPHYISLASIVPNPARDDFEFPKSVLVHEMMHGIYETKFKSDTDFSQVIFPFSLDGKNYETIDDSNFIKGVPDRGGHPYDSPHEAFASAAAAYYAHADKLVEFIQHPETPEAMKIFGKLIWCYMRDRVFGGKVFTSNGEDPFAEEKLGPLLIEASKIRTRSFLMALDDASVRRQKAEDLLKGSPDGLDVQLLKQWLKDNPSHDSYEAINYMKELIEEDTTRESKIEQTFRARHPGD